jgi:hypothetical protein
MYLTHPSYPLPHYRIGGRTVVRQSECDAWAARFRVVAPSRVDAIVSETVRRLLAYGCPGQILEDGVVGVYRPP